jgi:pyruvate/2-oxoglutarate dehydrogenase complex dihydrolipoamide dehydrogenase (E3) component
MWKPRRLKALWASTVFYKDSFVIQTEDAEVRKEVKKMMEREGEAEKEAKRKSSKKVEKLNSVAFSPQANYTDRATAAVGELSANF